MIDDGRRVVKVPLLEAGEKIGDDSDCRPTGPIAGDLLKEVDWLGNKFRCRLEGTTKAAAASTTPILAGAPPLVEVASRLNGEAPRCAHKTNATVSDGYRMGKCFDGIIMGRGGDVGAKRRDGCDDHVEVLFQCRRGWRILAPSFSPASSLLSKEQSINFFRVLFDVLI